MIAARAKWEPYLSLVRGIAASYGVAPELVLGIIQAESNFDPNAYRDEPQINDGSRGLMQVLLGTARALGFTGQPAQLFDPRTNVQLGTKLIAENLRARGGNVAKALSQYNGGYRPSLGFGEPLASGYFRNQTYVDRVLRFRDEFAVALAPVILPPTGTGGPGPGTLEPSDTGASRGVLILAAVLMLGSALVAFLRSR